ncbi:dienelactone hydrolase family protein [Chitinophaga sp.]|uniref:carboxylesterase family protein n=1 Tax=Chitinophaga sp. TaxID=1869181 RepID=UPI0031CFBEE1
MMKIGCTLLLCLIAVFAKAQTPDYSTYSYEEYIHHGDTLRYRMLTPLHYDIHKKYPLIIFLHGSGERGRDNAAQLTHGGALFLKDTIRDKYPAFVIFPQLPNDSTWGPLERTDSGRIFPADAPPTVPGRLVGELVDSLNKTGKIDTKKVYIGGLSLGGMGTFDLLARYPQKWAAGFPICGAGNVENAKKFKAIPVWIFHGGADPVVPVAGSRAYYDALKKLKAEVKYSEYPGVGHNSWDNAFAEPDLVPWLLSHKRK